MKVPFKREIYIKENQAPFFNDVENYCKKHSIPISNLVFEALEKYMIDRKSEEIILIIKKGPASEFKKIKFRGKKISSTEFLMDKVAVNTKSTKKFKKNHRKAHQYIFYRTNKNNLLVYLKKFHLKYGWDNDFKIINYDEIDILEETTEYKVYNDIEELLDDIEDIPVSCIDKIILEMGQIDVLDV